MRAIIVSFSRWQAISKAPRHMFFTFDHINVKTSFILLCTIITTLSLKPSFPLLSDPLFLFQKLSIQCHLTFYKQASTFLFHVSFCHHPTSLLFKLDALVVGRLILGQQQCDNSPSLNVLNNKEMYYFIIRSLEVVRIQSWLKYVDSMDIIKGSGSYPFPRENIVRIAKFFQGPSYKCDRPQIRNYSFLKIMVKE